ncbi:MAG: SRPBCC domain-containing protein [Chloroflexia bacterium]
MAEGHDPRPAAGEREIVIARTFDAPRTLIFRVWTEPEHLRRWFGPLGSTLTVCTIDLRPGGIWHYCLRDSSGAETWGRAVYREIIPPERLVFADSFSDAAGHLVEPTRYGMSPGYPGEVLVTVTFDERDGKTLLTLRLAIETAPGAEREAFRQGWNESLDRLAEALPSTRDVGGDGRDEGI